MATDDSARTLATCDVYVAALSSLRPHHRRILDDIEEMRARRYMHADDRDRFILGAVLLRIVAGRALRCDSEAVVVDRTCGRCGHPHGKARLVGTQLSASIAHSGEIVALAVTTDGPVGVDVEARRSLDYRPLVAEVCTDAEEVLVTGLDDFYVYWTRKEAFLKATGTGLRQPMRDVAVTPPGSPPAVLAVGGVTPPSSRLVDLALAEGYVGALAVLTSLPLHCTSHDAAPLLASAVSTA